MIEEPLHNEDVDRRLRKAHAERLQAARENIEGLLWKLRVHMGPTELIPLAELIDAKIELALLERGP